MTGTECSKVKISRWDLLFILILCLYPLRHINWGLDFWDTGYNYANFSYMGTEHMDSMWLFATYLSNVVGHTLTKLWGAGGLVGMNLYTGLFVSALAVMGYLFCTGKLGMEKWIAFAGELVAVSLCWCPTALLYNYLTYLLFTGCVILLYLGLTGEKPVWLFMAGVCLGTNVLVRFSNLPEAAMILAVWAYVFLAGRGRRDPETFGLVIKYTLWCLGGYLAALLVLFGYIHLRYGLDAYIAGIQRLLAMTDTATDYKSTSMLAKMVFDYVDNLYWILRIGVIVAAGMLIFAVTGLLEQRFEKAGKMLRRGIGICWCAVPVLMLCWLYGRGFCSTEYFSYGSILRPGISFLTLALGVGVIRIAQPGVPKEEKLVAGMVILMVLLTSIGSNNGIMPSLNHLFLAAPYVLWICVRFMRSAKDKYLGGKGIPNGLLISFFPAKTVLVALLMLFLFQSVVFGWCFVFAEATGAQNVTVTIENNKVLAGVKMNPGRAAWMEELSAYVEENGLTGQEVILFGYIPAMSYYLQMPSAFNPWSDLDSYHAAVMEQALAETAAEPVKPVVLLDATYALYMEGGEQALEAAGVSEKTIEKIKTNDRKIQLLQDYIRQLDYVTTFRNEKFVLMETDGN